LDGGGASYIEAARRLLPWPRCYEVQAKTRPEQNMAWEDAPPSHGQGAAASTQRQLDTIKRDSQVMWFDSLLLPGLAELVPAIRNSAGREAQSGEGW
jgi:hypothetical protein